MGPKARGRGWGGWGCCNIVTRHPSPSATLLQYSDHPLQHLMRGDSRGQGAGVGCNVATCSGVARGGGGAELQRGGDWEDRHFGGI